MYKLIIFLCVLTSYKSFSQVSEKEIAGVMDMEVPQSAGFVLIGVTPDKVIDPQSGKDLGVALLNGLDEKGNFQSGFSLETRPYFWGETKYIGEPTFRDRALAGLKFSFATAKGLDDKDKANRFGLGVNWTYQFNDPLFSNKGLVSCIKAAHKKVPNVPDDDVAGGSEEFDTEVKECEEKHLSWTVSAVSIGVASHSAKEEELGLRKSGYGIWLTGSYALTNVVEILGHLRKVDNQLVSGADGLYESDIDSVGARIRFGSSTIRGVVESSWNKDKNNQNNEEYTLVLIGAEFKVSKTAWFRLAYGDAIGTNEDYGEYFTGQLRFGFGE